METQGYEVKVAEFEGPFDLLLFFIERDELNIHDIPISKITNDFLEYLQHMQSLNMEVASEFILVAATLMKIKARTLLPRHQTEETEAVDMKEDLIQKLIAYKQFKNACIDLRNFEERQLRMAKRGHIALDQALINREQGHIEALSSVTLYKVLKVYARLITQFENRSQEIRHTVEQYPYTIEEQKTFLAELLKINHSLDFHNLLKNSKNRVHFVYNFLAVLEMLQQQLVQIENRLGYNNFTIRFKAHI